MFSNKSAGDLLLPTRYVMVAASRSGSTSAVMRLSSPIASTFSSQASRSLALGAPGGVPTGLVVSAAWLGLMVALISMVLLRRHLLTRIVAAHERHAIGLPSGDQQHRARDAAR